MADMPATVNGAKENQGKVGTWVHKYKHMQCGLHFEVLSWKEDWEIKACPECGQGGAFIQWSEELPGFIFQYVPGPTPMVAIAASFEEDEEKSDE